MPCCQGNHLHGSTVSQSERSEHQRLWSETALPWLISNTDPGRTTNWLCTRCLWVCETPNVVADIFYAFFRGKKVAEVAFRAKFAQRKAIKLIALKCVSDARLSVVRRATMTFERQRRMAIAPVGIRF